MGEEREANFARSVLSWGLNGAWMAASRCGQSRAPSNRCECQRKLSFDIAEDGSCREWWRLFRSFTSAVVLSVCSLAIPSPHTHTRTHTHTHTHKMNDVLDSRRKSLSRCLYILTLSRHARKGKREEKREEEGGKFSLMTEILHQSVRSPYMSDGWCIDNLGEESF